MFLIIRIIYRNINIANKENKCQYLPACSNRLYVSDVALSQYFTHGFYLVTLRCSGTTIRAISV